MLWLLWLLLLLLCRLMPGVEKVARVAADPELRDVATAAITVLTRVSKEGEEAAAQPEAAKADPQVRQWASAAGCGCDHLLRLTDKLNNNKSSWGRGED
jgi:hypothetical protein